MQESHARAGDRRLFEFLAASRPGRERRSAAAAIAASVGGHALIVGMAAWATVAAANRAWATPDLSGHDDFVVLLSPGQLDAHASDEAALAKHARYAHTEDTDRDAPPSSKELRAAPSADPVRTAVKIMPVIAPDPATDIEPVTRRSDAVFASLRESEYGGIGLDSASTRAAAILDERLEPTTEELAEKGPFIGSFTEPPELTNPEQVQRLLSRDYPENLKQGGVGGRVLLWFLVDEYGHVRRWLLKRSSGHAALDKVAMKAAAFMRFKPAWNYDRHVALWIVLPITFMVDDEG